jgi:hypothetical protein
MIPSKQDVNVGLKLARATLYLILHLSIITIWNMWTTKDILVMGNAQPSSRAHACNLHNIWVKQ